jgi:simple sugar transport system ATP-binding protein
VSEGLGFQFDEATRIDGLDVAAQQRVEIVKALMHQVRLLVLDEPTAVLGPEDKEYLFATIRRLKSKGTAVILISHKLEDIFAVSDRAMILRNGAVVASAEAADLTRSDIVQHMVGTRNAAEADAIVTAKPSSRDMGAVGGVICRIYDVALKRPNGSVAISGLTLDLHAGEIVAVAGVDGNGQSELVRVLAGMARPDQGSIVCLGETSEGGRWSAAQLRRIGVAHVPEDRRRSGIVGSMTLARNYLLRHIEHPAFSRVGLLREGALERTVAARLAEFQVRCTGPADRMERLSGGNQQKVVLAREMDGDPRLILAAHPSRGLDIRTIRFVHRLLEEARDAGKTVLLLSSDLDEILQLADRILVFAGGRVFGPARRGEIGRSEIGAWIAGHAEAVA